MKLLIVINIFLFSIGCANQSADDQQTAPEKKVSNQNKVAAEAAAVPFPVYMTFDEFEHHIQQQNDTTYVVNFWATWCKPCVAELPWFEQLIPAYKEKPVKVLLVSMDFPKQIKTKLIPFVEQRKLQNSVVALADMDYNEWIDKVSKDWDGAIPFTLIYNSNKQQIKLGEMDGYDELENLLAGVMN